MSDQEDSVVHSASCITGAASNDTQLVTTKQKKLFSLLSISGFICAGNKGKSEYSDKFYKNMQERQKIKDYKGVGKPPAGARPWKLR